MNLTNQETQIKEIRKLASSLIDLSRTQKWKYSFKKEYLDKFLDKSFSNSSKSIISFEDLPPEFILNFNKKGKKLLEEVTNLVRKHFGLDVVNRRYKVNFYLAEEYISNKTRGIKVCTIQKYIRFLHEHKIMDLKGIKDNVIQIKPNIKAKPMQLIEFPVDLKYEKWAFIFGLIPDTFLKDFKIVAEDQSFAKDIRCAIELVGVKNPYFKRQGNVVAIRGHSVMSYFIKIAGFETNKTQSVSNNVLPSWMFFCSQIYHGILLSKFLDTEGFISKGSGGVRIAQSSLIGLTKGENEFILSKCKTRVISSSKKESKIILFSNLTKKLKEKVLLNPSFLLISIQLLLKKYDVKAVIYPQNVYISSNGKASISWHLVVFGLKNIQKLNDLCGQYISIPYKKEALKNLC